MQIHRKFVELARKCLVVLKIRQIKSRDFTIIASNCTGSLPYRFLKLPYATPTISLFFHAPDYVRFVKRLDYYLNQPIKFVPSSKYAEGRALQAERDYYPVGWLDDVEIHFLHYNSEEEAVDKWERRKNRINRDNLILTFTDKDLCTPELLAEFDALPYPRKIALTSKPYPELKSCVQLKAFAGQDEVGDTYTRYDTLLQLNFSALIDGTGGTIDSKVEDKRLSAAQESTPAEPASRRFVKTPLATATPMASVNHSRHLH